MKPGDMIEWVTKLDMSSVNDDELLWSSIEKRWVPIGEKALLISLAGKVMTYLCSKGLFRAHMDDTSKSETWSSDSTIVPHVIRS